MEKKISIKKNMIMNFILTGANFIFPLITYPYVARILQPAGTGKVAFATSILSYFSYIAILGIPTYGVRQCVKVRENKKEFTKTVQEIFTINMVSTIIAYLALAVIIILVPRVRENKILFIIMSVSILLNTIGMEWVYQALEQYSYITIRSIIFKCISVILIFLFIKDTNDYIIYGALYIFTMSASNICNFINIRKYIYLKPIKNREYKKHLKPIFALFAASMAIMLYANFDIVMIGFIKDDSMVGMYNAALKIKSIVLSVSTAITAVLVPRMARYYSDDLISEFRNLGLKSLHVSAILAMPLTTYILMNAKDILIFVCGSEYIPATTTLQILMLCTYALILTNLFGNQYLIIMGMEKRYTQSVIIGMFINIGLNFALIPSYGSAGAAIGTLVTEWFNVYWMSSGIKNEAKFLVKNVNVMKYIIATSISVILCLVMKCLTVSLSVFFRLVFTTIFYFGSYYIILLLLKEPILISQFNSIKMKLKRRCI